MRNSQCRKSVCWMIDIIMIRLFVVIFSHVRLMLGFRVWQQKNSHSNVKDAISMTSSFQIKLLSVETSSISINMIETDSLENISLGGGIRRQGFRVISPCHSISITEYKTGIRERYRARCRCKLAELHIISYS